MYAIWYLTKLKFSISFSSIPTQEKILLNYLQPSKTLLQSLLSYLIIILYQSQLLLSQNCTYQQSLYFVLNLLNFRKLSTLNITEMRNVIYLGFNKRYSYHNLQLIVMNTLHLDDSQPLPLILNILFERKTYISGTSLRLETDQQIG